MTQHTEQEVKPCKFENGACIHCEATERGDCEGYVCDDSLYASYTKRPWVGLTDEDWVEIGSRKNTVLDTFACGAAWAADQLEERNT
jgi:hypothetical protein